MHELIQIKFALCWFADGVGIALRAGAPGESGSGARRRARAVSQVRCPGRVGARMAAAACGDRWGQREIRFATLGESRDAVNDSAFLDSYFEAWNRTLDAVDAAPDIKCCTAFARQVTRHDNGVNVLMIGETGAGKSLLVKVMTGDEDVKTSATSAGTAKEERFKTHSRLNFVDTPGFKLPLSPEEARQENVSWFARQRDEFAWSRWLSKIEGYIQSRDLKRRPSVVLYCHRGSSRIIPQRMMEIFKLPHLNEVYTYIRM